MSDDHAQIVAILYQNCTITNPDKIYSIIDLQLPFKPISRAMCRMMSRMDLGDKWGKIAELPTVFYFDWKAHHSRLD